MVNPYVGPRPFERKDSNLFFGRNQEASELLSLVVANRAVVLYAPSGAGKTSLLNALVVPLLEKEGDLEVYPFARVRGPVLQGVDPADIANIYVFYTLLSWCGSSADPQALAKQTLTQFLASPPPGASPPAADEGVLSIGKFLTDAEPAFAEEELPPARVLVFDQFEELFTTYPERWRDREGFFNQLERALHDDPLLRVVFSLREDYVAQLDPYAPLLPKHLRTRFRLERMQPDAALAAVRNPLQGSGRQFAPGVAEQLVEDLRKVRVQSATGETVAVTGEYIEPVQLQVVCQNLWQDLPADVSTITQAHLKTYGNVTQALSRFYQRAIEQALQATALNESVLRDWFAHTLITPAGTRGTVYRGQQDTGGIPNPAVDLLENLHIIRGEWRAGARWYELTHDRLIEPIQASNEKWRERQRQAQIKRVTAWIAGAAALVAVVLCLALLYITYLTAFPQGTVADETAEAVSYESGRATAEALAAASSTISAQSTNVAATSTRQVEATQAAQSARATSQAASVATLAYVATAQAGIATPDVSDTSSAEYLIAQTSFFPVMSNEERIMLLANLFNLPQTNRGRYDVLARQLFYGLESTSQIAMFENLPAPAALERELVVTIEGLMPALAPLPNGSDLALLEIWNKILEQANPQATTQLRQELNLWLNGRQLAINQSHEGAAALFSRALTLDPANPMLYYDRALSYAALGELAASLGDLEFMLGQSYTLEAEQSPERVLEAQQLRDVMITADQVVEQVGRNICADSALLRALSSNREPHPLLAATNILRPFAFAGWPTLSQRISLEFGADPELYRLYSLPGHPGIDFDVDVGTPVYAIADGRVERTDTSLTNALYGIYIRVRHEYGCQVYYTTYANLSEIRVFEGQWLQAGDQLALSGRSGNALGPLLHLTLQQDGAEVDGWPNGIIDPALYLFPSQQLPTAP